VRAALTEQQRRIGRKGRIVMVGRDIGTVVLPDADLKIYLNATVEERAERRCRELAARGEPADYDVVLASLLRRDQIDSGRTLAPLRPAEDAVVIDTTSLNVSQVLERVLALVDGHSRDE
jgi:cytidylate kinase